MRSARLIARVLAAACLVSPLAAGEPDWDVPSQHAFREWPPAELSERLYPLPWSPMAFRRAEVFSRPVFFMLTVDWSRAAQRLIRDVLSDPDVRRIINDEYIMIVANADLRPDVRERYQTGVWPVVAFLLPDGNPMLSQVADQDAARPITTTAVDKQTLLFLLTEGVKYWDRRSGLLRQVGREWSAREGQAEPVAGLVDAVASEAMARWLVANADRAQGGFGVAPKFLVPAFQEYAELRKARSLPVLARHARLTLETLVASPLFDRSRGGMHRLAAGPSFSDVQPEKMLLGNAFLIRQLVGSLRAEDSTDLRRALETTSAFVTGELARSGGGFYFAQYADAEGGLGAGSPVDRLVLSGPNALAGAALVRAGMFLDDRALVAAGRAALDLVHDRALRSGRGVFHVIEPFRDPRVFLQAQADVALAFADAYETTGEERFLDAAQDIADFAWRNLKGGESAALLDGLTQEQPLGLLANERRPFRANMRMARAMLRLELFGRGERYRAAALELISAYSGSLDSFGVHGTEGALAVEEAISEPLVVTVSGPPDAAATRALRRAALNTAWPWTVVTSAEQDQPGARLEHGGRSFETADAATLRDAALRLAAGEQP